MRPTIILAATLALAVVAGAGYLGTRQAAGSDQGRIQEPTTVGVERGDVQETVSAPGHIDATRTTTLSTGTAGRLAQVNVRPGDRVQAGTTLARLDTASLELQLQKAQVDLKTAQDHLAQARNPNTAQEIDAARARLDAARAGYDKLKAGATQADLAAGRAAVASAQAAYDAAVRTAGTSSSQLDEAAATLTKAQVDLQQAQTRYDRVASSPDIAMRPEATALQTATIDYDKARAAYEALQSTAGANASSQVLQARSALEQARASLTRLESQATAADLASAQAQLAQAKSDLDKLLAGTEANALDIAQNGVVTAEIAVKQAQLDLDGARVVAPFDGVVQEVKANPGDALAAGASVVVLTDPAALEVVGTVVEEDLSLVQIGQAADLFFDAQPDAAVQGHVARIVPLRDTTQDRTAYPVAITLASIPERLMPGMTVDAAITIAARHGVLRLPRALVRAGAGGKATVQVWTGDHTESHTVTVGLRGDVYVEIVDGLAEGERVVGQ